MIYLQNCPGHRHSPVRQGGLIYAEQLRSRLSRMRHSLLEISTPTKPRTSKKNGNRQADGSG